MTYLVDALRITMAGSPTDHLIRDVLVLAGFGIVSFLGTIWVIRRHRRWTPARLHPLLG